MISLKQFIDENNGKYVSFKDSDKHPKECVTLVQEYLRQCYGIPFKARGNAKDWANGAGIGTVVKTPEYGDLVVFPNHKEYGHIGIYIDANGYFDQYNGKKASYTNRSVPTNSKRIYVRVKGTRPKDEVTSNVYVVKKGDTLSKIASKYETTYQELAKYNGIKNPNLIKVGQKINIPTSNKPTTKKYIQINALGGVWCRKSVGGGIYKIVPNKTKCELLEKNVGTRIILGVKYSFDKIEYKGEIVYIPNKWNTYI